MSERYATSVAAVRWDSFETMGNEWRRYSALFSRGDIVKAYNLPEGRVREFLPASEALAESSMETGIGVPLTLGHPPARPGSGRMLRTDSVVGEAHGAVLAVRAHADGIHTEGEFVVWSKKAQDFIDERLDAAKRGDGQGPELSVGFEPGLDPTPGTFEGERYDRVQTHPLWNHAALELRGNAKTARVLSRADYLDGDIVDSLRPILDAETIERRVWVDLGAWTRHDGLIIPADSTPDRTDSTTMTTREIKFDGATHEVPGPVHAHILRLTERTDALEAEAKVAQTKADADAKTIATLETESKQRTDALADTVSRVDHEAEIIKAKAESGKGFADAMGTARALRGSDFAPERTDSLEDWQLGAIEGAYGDRFETIKTRIDAAGEVADDASSGAKVAAAARRVDRLDMYFDEARDIAAKKPGIVEATKRTIAGQLAGGTGTRSDALAELEAKMAAATANNRNNYSGAPSVQES